eukprot:SAG22_NODE_966_length_6261_cov_686.210125_2_plen_249_part_00
MYQYRSSLRHMGLRDPNRVQPLKYERGPCPILEGSARALTSPPPQSPPSRQPPPVFFFYGSTRTPGGRSALAPRILEATRGTRREGTHRTNGLQAACGRSARRTGPSHGVSRGYAVCCGCRSRPHSSRRRRGRPSRSGWSPWPRTLRRHAGGNITDEVFSWLEHADTMNYAAPAPAPASRARRRWPSCCSPPAPTGPRRSRRAIIRERPRPSSPRSKATTRWRPGWGRAAPPGPGRLARINAPRALYI